MKALCPGGMSATIIEMRKKSSDENNIHATKHTPISIRNGEKNLCKNIFGHIGCFV